MKSITIDGSRISDATSFHAVFATALGFPDFYGHNFDAWVDCMSYLNDENAAMTSVHVAPGGQLAIVVENAEHIRTQCPDVWLSFLESAAFVNWRCTECSEAPLLVVCAG
jgi:hypothetical protein